MRALLRQTICMTIILFKTPTPEHQHRSAAGLEALKTTLWQQLVVMARPIVLVAIPPRQRPWLHLMTLLNPRRAVHGRRIDTVTGDRLLPVILPLVAVVDDFPDDRDPQNPGSDAGKVTVTFPGSGRGCADRCDGNRDRGDGCDKLAVHRSDPFSTRHGSSPMQSHDDGYTPTSPRPPKTGNNIPMLSDITAPKPHWILNIRWQRRTLSL
ncbi:hypothetical protein RGAI101_611 [Roseobacter sp. GAI101]|nr:hypothetical protein RGAI101_611 [Roseobacter sp. GAI101]